MTKVTEAELRAGAVAPRVTEIALESNIAAVNYLNVGKAIARTDAPDHASHHLLTICVIVLKNGFTVTGESACASPENYNEKVGQMIAYEHAKEKIWPLMGYALKEHLFHEGKLAKSWLDGDQRRNGLAGPGSIGVRDASDYV